MNIIVTGASRGIGYETVRLFTESPENKVMAISRNEQKLRALKADCLKSNPGAGILIHPYDLENFEGVETELRELIFREFQSIDILINNAGFLVNAPVMEMDIADAARMMRVNFLIPLVLVRTMMPLLDRAESAHVVNIGSMAGVPGAKKFPGLSAYSASKAAVHILTECLAEEFKGGSVRFNALALGSVQTEMFSEAFPGLKAPLQPSEMASFIRDFSSTGHRYFNGKTLPVAVTTP